MIFFYISTAIFVGGIFIVYWIHNQHDIEIVIKPTSPSPDASFISVCVPARNEERNIRACVESILSQDYPNFEVIVLEDHSTDATPEILDNLARVTNHHKVPFKIIHGSDLPKGWAGKPHALFQASAA